MKHASKPPPYVGYTSGGGPEVTFTYSSPRKAKRETAAGHQGVPLAHGTKKRFIWNVHWNWILGTPIAPSGESQQQKTTNTTRGDASVPWASVHGVHNH